MENKKIDMKWCSGYCRQYWPEECAHILRIADDADRKSTRLNSSH